MGAARPMHQAMGALADWMSSNQLRLNAQKTKFIWLGNRQQLAKISLDALSAEFPTMSFSQVVRDLGALLDSELTFSHHTDQVRCSCYYQLRQLRVTARSLTCNDAVSLAHAFVFSRLDYCSSIFAGLPGVRMEKLRWVHRATARLNAALSPHVQAVVHSPPLLTVIWWCHSPGLRQCRPVHFLWLAQKPGMDFQ